MRVGDFYLSIEGRSETSDGYVKLPHNTQYKIKLGNTGNRRSDCEVSVDGKSVGTFRIDSDSTIILERPIDDSGKFTFYKDGTSEARAAELDLVSKDDRGLISVTFKPEKETTHSNYNEPKWVTGSFYPQFWKATKPDLDLKGPAPYHRRVKTAAFNLKGLSGQSVTSGGTGLSGNSNQTFYDVANLDCDTENFVTINLRLVAGEDGPRPLKKKIKTNPIPPPV